MEKREKQIYNASVIAVIGNGILAGLKIVIGFITGSMAVLADGIDSAGDIIASTITLIVAKIISKPPDKRFPYGYGKADVIASKALSFIVFFAGAQLAIETTRKIISNDYGEMPGMLAIIVTLVSIVGKTILAFYQYAIGRKTKSSMLKANGLNMRGDIVISLSVLVGLVFTFGFKMPVLDKIVALVVSGWIMWVGYKIFMESSFELMDGNKNTDIYSEIFTAIKSVPGVQNPHRVRARNIGHKVMIAIDIEMSGELSLQEAHKLGHDVEIAIKNKIDNVFDVALHIEPIGDNIAEMQLGLSPDNI